MKDSFSQSRHQKITSLFNSQRRYSRSGSITTAKDQEDDILKSRIMNLPNYKKETLECRLDFVVVFQTIEIERLSVEIQSLRVRLLDSERQIFNYKNYEIQIRELTERCFQYEKERYNQQSQINRLHLVNLQLQDSCNHLEKRAIIIEDQLHERQDEVFRLKEGLIIEKKQRQQVEDFRLQLESNLKEKEKVFSRQLKQLEKSTQLKKYQLNKNQQNMGQLLKKYQQEIQDLRKENASLRSFYDSIEQQSRQLEQRYQELQEELGRTAELLKQKQFQMQAAEQEHEQRMETLEARYEQELRDKCKILDENENELTEWKRAVEKQDADIQSYQIKVAQYNQQIEKYELLLNEAGDEIDRLNTIIKDKIKYLEAWQQRYKQLEAKTNAAELEKNSLLHKLATSQQQITKLNYSLKIKIDQLEKSQRLRDSDSKQIKDKLAESESIKSQFILLKKQRDQDRQQHKHRHIENNHLKQQLNKRIAECNKLFESLNLAESQSKQKKKYIVQVENAMKKLEEDIKQSKSLCQAYAAKNDKLAQEKRNADQDLLRLKALQERVKHEENKKNQYFSQGKKLTQKVKEYEKMLSEKKNEISKLEEDISKYETYTQKIQQRNKYLQSQLELLEQLIKEINLLRAACTAGDENLKTTNSVLNQKSNQLKNLKQKVASYINYMKQFKVQEQKFKEQLVVHERIAKQLKDITQKYQEEEDKNYQLEVHCVKIENDRDNCLKQIGNLEKVIEINTLELKRVEQNLAETKEEINSRKQNQRQQIIRIKQLDKKLKLFETEIEKEKHKITKDKNQIEKQFQKKFKEIEVELKSERSEKQRILQSKEKMLRQKEEVIALLNLDSDDLKDILKKNEQEKEKVFRYSRELEKKIASIEHELERLTFSSDQTKTELKISNSYNEKLALRLKDLENTILQQNQKLAKEKLEKQQLKANFENTSQTLQSKEKDIGHLMNECKQFKQQMRLLFSEIKQHQQTISGMEAEIIRLKFESQNINHSYNGVRSRMVNLEEIIQQLKVHLTNLLGSQKQLEVYKVAADKKIVEYQDQLMGELQRMEEIHFKQSEQIIRLQSSNKMLTIQIGEFKQRESLMFSKIKESSIVKERQKDIKDAYMLTTSEELPIKEKKRVTSQKQLRMSRIDKSLKQSSIIGQINITSKKSRTTRIQQDEFEDVYSGEKREGMMRNSKHRIYFENLVFKNV